MKLEASLEPWPVLKVSISQAWTWLRLRGAYDDDVRIVRDVGPSVRPSYRLTRSVEHIQRKEKKS